MNGPPLCFGLTSQLIARRRPASSNQKTTNRAARDRSAAPSAQNKKATQQRGLFCYFRRDLLGTTEGNPLAGGAQIVGRRLARAAIRYNLVADLLAFTQRSKSGPLYAAAVHDHVVATFLPCSKP